MHFIETPQGMKGFMNDATIPATITPTEPKQLAHGNRGDWYLMANVRRICSAEMKRSKNWVLAKELFATGSTSAWQICIDAGIDPEAKTVTRSI